MNGTRNIKDLRNFSFVLAFLIFVSLLLPSRFFQSFSFFQVSSSLNCNYLNFSDFLFLLIGLYSFALVKKFGFLCNKQFLVIPLIFSFISFANVIGLALSNYLNYIPEIFSKIIIVWSSFWVITFFEGSKTSRLFSNALFFSFLVLSASTIFLTKYGSYLLSGRTGTLGFGINETAMINTALLAYVLFNDKLFWPWRISSIVIVFASLFLTESRRGLLVSAFVVFLWVVVLLVKGYRILCRKKSRKFANILLLSFAFGLFVVILASFRIVMVYFMKIPAFARVLNSLTQDSSLVGTDRLIIYQSVIGSLKNYYWFGHFGSDKLFANLVMGGTVHAHNLFLELLSVNGVVFGSLFSLFFLVVLAFSFLLVFLPGKSNMTFLFPRIIFLVFFLWESFGYSLWNPKMLFLILSCCFCLFYSAAQNVAEGKNDLFLRNRYCYKMFGEH